MSGTDGEPGMMAAVKVAPGTRSLAVVMVLGALTGGAAWLGVVQSPSGHHATRWETFLAETRAAGTLTFSTTVRSSGLASSPSQSGEDGSGISLDRVSGAVDFPERDAIELSEAHIAEFSNQWTETVAVDGTVFLRNGIDGRGGPSFRGPWLRGAGLSLPPFGVIAGTVGPGLPIGPPHLVKLGRAVLDGTPTTDYQVSSIRIYCTGSADVPPQTERSRVWVDDEGRIRRWESVTVAHLGGVIGTTRTTTITEFGGFGRSVRVRPPATVIGSTSPPPPTEANQLAGCLITPG